MILLLAAVLFLDGGSNEPKVGAAFGQLAGGPAANILFVPTALPERALNEVNLKAMPKTAEAYFGVPRVVILHAFSREEADSEAFVQPIKTATAVYFMGGDHSLLLQRYAGTRFEAELKAFHARGGTVGGSSAGAMVLGSYQGARKNGRITDEPSNWAGFGLLPNTLVDVHFSERKRHPHIPPILKRHGKLRAIGIDERTAAILRDGDIEVVGNGSVTVFDGKAIRVLRAVK
jgi:cyanophycinase